MNHRKYRSWPCSQIC